MGDSVRRDLGQGLIARRENGTNTTNLNIQCQPDICLIDYNDLCKKTDRNDRNVKHLKREHVKQRTH